MYPDGAPLAYKVDHVGVVLDDADQAFAFCRDTLRLPVSWDLAEYGAARTGGICLGNLNFEVLDQSTVGGLPTHHPAAVGLVAFQPAPHSIQELLDALAARGVAYLGPFSTGDPVFGFTNVVPAGLGFDAGFFCSYHFPGSHDNAVRQTELELADGGALGLIGVAALRAAVDRDSASVASILGPTDDDQRWTFPTGPALVVDRQLAPGTALMEWSVRDVAAATAELVRNGAVPEGGAVRIPQLGGLLVELSGTPTARSAGLAERRAHAFSFGRSLDDASS